MNSPGKGPVEQHITCTVNRSTAEYLQPPSVNADIQMERYSSLKQFFNAPKIGLRQKGENDAVAQIRVHTEKWVENEV